VKERIYLINRYRRCDIIQQEEEEVRYKYISKRIIEEEYRGGR